MKLTDLALIFLVLEIIIFGILDIRYNQLEAVTANTNAYNIALDNAVDDGCFFLVESDSSRNLYTNKERGMEQFFYSLYANFGVMGQPVYEKKLQEYIPVILVTDRDGFYINYSELLEKAGEKFLIRHWSEKIPYSYETDEFICCFSLGDFIRVYDKNSNEITEGDYKDIRISLPIDFLQEDNFDTFRRNAIINAIKEKMNNYINYYNSIAGQFGITYEFWLPEIEETDWYRTIDDISLFVIFQGYPYQASSLDTYNRYAFGGARIKKTKLYYITETAGMKYYHRNNCTELIGDLREPYYSKEECAKAGAFPCLKCIP